jgi:four helix bundle protein
MNERELKDRTKRFGLDIIKLASLLPNTVVGRIIGNQLIRAGTSVGANYRSACRARSKAEFAAKLGIVEEEADESAYWMELVVESGLLEEDSVRGLIADANEIVAMMVASRRSVTKRLK